LSERVNELIDFAYNLLLWGSEW